MAGAVGLPEGFVLDQSTASPAPTGLPQGFVLDQQAAEPQSGIKQFASDAARGIGLGARAAVEGAAGIPIALTDAAGRLVMGDGYQPVSNTLSNAGLPEPASAMERVGSAIGRGGTSLLSGLGAGQLLRESSNQLAKNIGNTLIASPGAQAVAGSTSGLSSQLAAEAGASPELQQIAGLAGGIAGGVGARSLDAIPQNLPVPRGAATSGVEAAQIRNADNAVVGQPTANGLRGLTDQADNALDRTSEYRKAVATLKDAGVKLTRGQESGTNWVKSTERSMADIPVTGKPLQKRFEVQQQEYQKALLQKAGNQRGDNMVTRQTLDNTADDLSADYAKALGNKSINISDDSFLDDLGSIEAKHSQFVDDPTKSKVKQIVNSFLEQASKEGEVTGEWYQKQRSLFAGRAKKNTEVADLYGDLKTLLDDAFARSAGGVKGNLDSRYARYKQLQSIFERTGGPAASEGFISPVAVAREASGAPGGRDWQDFTRAAAAVLPDRLGNSGTAQRNFVLGLAGGSIPAALIEPTTAAVTLGAMAGGRGLSSVLANPSATNQALLNYAPDAVSPLLFPSAQGSR